MARGGNDVAPRSQPRYLALPFVVFKIPGLSNLLMHTSRTGYNRRGRTVPVIKMFTPPADTGYLGSTRTM